MLYICEDVSFFWCGVSSSVQMLYSSCAANFHKCFFGICSLVSVSLQLLFNFSQLRQNWCSLLELSLRTSRMFHCCFFHHVSTPTPLQGLPFPVMGYPFPPPGRGPLPPLFPTVALRLPGFPLRIDQANLQRRPFSIHFSPSPFSGIWNSRPPPSSLHSSESEGSS